MFVVLLEDQEASKSSKHEATNDEYNSNISKTSQLLYACHLCGQLHRMSYMSVVRCLSKTTERARAIRKAVVFPSDICSK